jgi:YegS/Rv2252/BmrU family lipid kinase
LGDKNLAPILSKLRDFGIEPLTPPSPLAVWEFADHIRARAADLDLVIVGGGDGTLSTVAKAVADCRLPMGILPLGTANDLARTLGIPLSPVEAAEVIAAGRLRSIDLGLANGHPFFNVVTIGLAADLASCLDKTIKQRLGKLGYAVAALRVAIGARRFTASIRTQDGVEKVKTYQIAIGNGRYYGGGVIVHSGATIHDGMLDLYSLELETLWKLAFNIGAFTRGQHGDWDDVRIDRAASFEIATRHPVPVNADGEIVTQTPLKVEVVRGALRILAPS